VVLGEYEFAPHMGVLFRDLVKNFLYHRLIQNFVSCESLLPKVLHTVVNSMNVCANNGRKVSFERCRLCGM
jgi:hypothetical protein